MASIAKRAGGWRAQIALKGIRDSKTFSTKAEAVAWSAMRETEIREEVSTGICKDKTIDDAFRRYIKEVSAHKKGYQWELRRLTWLGEQTVDSIKFKDIKLLSLTPATLGAWRDKRLNVDKVAGSTINREFNLLSHVFSTAKTEWKWLVECPTTGVRRPKNPAPRDRLLTQEEIDRISLALGFCEAQVASKMQTVAVAFLFAIETAMRAGEICGLIPTDIVGRKALLGAEHNPTKNGGKREVPLSTRAIELLGYLTKPSGDGKLFGINTASLDALFRKGRGRANVEGVTFHDTRHAAITRLAKKLNVLDLARMVGHRDLRMLQIYYNEAAEEMALKLD